MCSFDSLFCHHFSHFRGTVSRYGSKKRRGPWPPAQTERFGKEIPGQGQFFVARKVLGHGNGKPLPSALRQTPPLVGEAFNQLPAQKAPLPGELDAPQAQTEGSCFPEAHTFRDVPTAGSRPRPTDRRKRYFWFLTSRQGVGAACMRPLGVGGSEMVLRGGGLFTDVL